jgi:signal transduction histidine kinase
VELTEQKLEKEKIEQQKAQQAELNRLKDKLLSVISHDLRSPLVSFEAFFNLLTNHFDQLDKNEILKLTQSARNNLEQQKQLLNNLLEWAKSQWEGSSFRPEKLDLSKIVNRNVSLLQSTADIKQLTIEIDLLKDATIYADREMIEFVVRNVLHNAIKFSRTLSKIGIKVEKINEAIVLIIRDEGVGMSAEVLKSLTYQELGVSTKGTANEKGTGLGLVICREFITRNNGHLSIESVLNQGTTVSIKFPVSLD